MRRLLLLIAVVLFVGLFAGLYRSGRFGFGVVRTATSFPREFLRFQFTSGSEERTARGAELFLGHCSSCHGLQQADTALLAQRGFAKFGDLAMARFLKDGPTQGDMPPFRAKIRDLHIFDIIAYLRSLGDVPANAPPDAPAVADGYYLYVALNGAIRVYDVAQDYKIVKQIRVPGMIETRGIVASQKTGLLHVSFDGLDRADFIGTLACIDLATDKILWSRNYTPGVDSMALSPDGKTIYMPGSEADRNPDGGKWLVLDALTGDERKRLVFGTSPHNTIVDAQGKFVFFAGALTNYLGVVDMSTDTLVRKIGPFTDGVRPFALTSDGKYVLANINSLAGFEIADLQSGKVIHRVQVEGFPLVEPGPNVIQTHGVALSPDETEAWVCDAPNRTVHVFDVTGLPNKPRQIASIPVRRPQLVPTWINFSHDGRHVRVSNGAIIDAKSREIVQWIADSRYYMEIGFQQGKPVAAYPRYGNGYAHQTWWSEQENKLEE